MNFSWRCSKCLLSCTQFTYSYTTPKPGYHPPSSTDRVGFKPKKSNLPFDFWFSYAESSASIDPLGSSSPTTPFWSGLFGQRVDRRLGSCGRPESGSVESERELEEKRRVLRERERELIGRRKLRWRGSEAQNQKTKLIWLINFFLSFFYK